jgi:hypothetical protein
MRWANLVLSYLQVVAWPIVVALVVYLFRSQLGTLMLSTKRVTAFGAEAEFEKLGQQLEITELQLDRVTAMEPIDEAWKSTPPTRELPNKETAEKLTAIDFGGLDSDDSISAAEQAVRLLDSAMSNVLTYFDIPDTITDSHAIGQIMQFITGDKRWPGFMKVFSGIKDSIVEVGAIYNDAQRLSAAEVITRVRKSIQTNIGMIYELALLLPRLITNGAIGD